MPRKAKKKQHQISTLNEKPLHAALKSWYEEPGDEFEVWLDGYLIDIVRGDLLIEIQTRNFSSLKRKLAKLTVDHLVRLVFPIAQEKYIVRMGEDGATPIGRRKSPKRGIQEHVFQEMVALPHLMKNERFSLEILLIGEEEVRVFDEKRAWRRKGWVTQERRLLDVRERRLFESPADVASLLPDSLKSPFTTAELAEETGLPRWLAQKMAYCLRGMDVLERVGKRGNAILHTRVV
jgi:hypothetical protein